MFWKIFAFEVQNRLRRPAVYIFFLTAFIFAAYTFAKGALPDGENEHINSPRLIAWVIGYISILMMLVTSTFMGTPLYRDIEYNTKDYYLTYPITKFGYYWGRYFSSLLFVLLIAVAVLLGAFVGTQLGPLFGFNDESKYGPNLLMYYLNPFVFIALPNLIFTSSIFYGLVAITRNLKVIYSSGIILFLCYLIARFYLRHTDNQIIIKLADPFALSNMFLQYRDLNEKLWDVTLVTYQGFTLVNRILWPGLGIVTVVASYLKFNFEDFFSGKHDKRSSVKGNPDRSAFRPEVTINFDRKYNLQSLLTLTKTELLNILKDSYFWIIMSCGLIFLCFCFSQSTLNNYGILNFPRTVGMLTVFNEVFLYFIFFVIIFYTGETIHRDRVTRFSFINDSLPMPNWVLSGSKLLSLLVLGACFSIIPMVLGIGVQLAKGYTQLNLPVYLQFVFTLILPRFLEMVVFAYVIHVVVNNKFAAHGIGIAIWILLHIMDTTKVFNYRPLLYSYTPNYEISDMDGLGHMATPVAWFNLYWMLAAACLAVIAALFYYRGTATSLKERLLLAKERFAGSTQLISAVLSVAFLAVGSYVYYNVSYLNNYLTKAEIDERAVIYERTLKRYDNLPLPKVKAMKLTVNLFPHEQRAETHGYITLINETAQPVVEVLIDAEDVTKYDLKLKGENIPFTTPLIFKRGKMNLFRPEADTSDFRLYRLRQALAPGDSMVIEINSSVFYRGFGNNLYSKDILGNGTFFRGGLPNFGYDDDDELTSPYERKKFNLPPRTVGEMKQDDPEGINTLRGGKAGMLLKFDLTVSTDADQIAVAPGELRKQWKANGRSYFHYVQDKPGMYPPFVIVSGKYQVAHDQVPLVHGKKVAVDIYYHPQHPANVDRFRKAYHDGLRYYSGAYGDYPFKVISLAETTPYGPRSFSATSFNSYTEKAGWNAAFKTPDQLDHCYYQTCKFLAQQWWRFQVAPNNTIGSFVIPEGLSQYDSFVMMENLMGKNNMTQVLLDPLEEYLRRRDLSNSEQPVLNANKWYIWGNKAGLALYGLRDLIGEKNMNSALREFKNEFALKKSPPYAGSRDLYQYLKAHTPDSLQYYLKDTWEKVTFYDNRILSAKAAPIGKDTYKVTIKVDARKSYLEGKNEHVPAPMNDYIDLAVMGAPLKDKTGRKQENLLYMKKQKFTSGEHTIVLLIKGKPVSVGVDPFMKLVDRILHDNIKEL